MKKILIAILTLLCVLGALCSCGPKENGDAIDNVKLETLITDVASKAEMGADEWYKFAFTSPEDATGVVGAEISASFEEGVLCRPEISMGFEYAIFRAESADAAQTLANELSAKANPNKWICMTAASVKAEVRGRTVLFVMASEQSANALSDAFKTIEF